MKARRTSIALAKESSDFGEFCRIPSRLLREASLPGESSGLYTGHAHFGGKAKPALFMTVGCEIAEPCRETGAWSCEDPSNCLGCQARRAATTYSEARMPQLTDQRSRPPNSVSHPCDVGSMAHATVRACSECRRADLRCPKVFEDLGYLGLSRLGCLKTSRERTPT